MRSARARGEVLVQPRCGVGSHEGQLALLRQLEADAAPDIGTITIDSYTRLGAFDKAAEVLRRSPSSLNGYPLVAHGPQKVRELKAAVRSPIQIRHGSPDPRRLFLTALDGGVDGFEGGPLSYTLPYSKSVSLSEALHAWDQVDELCGELAACGIDIDREYFGSLSGTLVHPVIALSVTFIEAMKSFRSGGRCAGVAVSQSGCVYQDIAALRAVTILARRLCPDHVVYPVFHHFMGVFPRDPRKARAVIAQGSITARLGGAVKVIVKTEVEAIGIPDGRANANAINLTRDFLSPRFDGFMPAAEKIEEEADFIVEEAGALVTRAFLEPDVNGTIVRLFANGHLDVPFCPSRYCRGACVPRRGKDGAIRIVDPGQIPFSAAFLQREKRLAEFRDDDNLISHLVQDIEYFAGD
jgi:methylaspartate mutase epsilon subunit